MARGVIYAGHRVEVSLLVRVVKCLSIEFVAIGVGSEEVKNVRFWGPVAVLL